MKVNAADMHCAANNMASKAFIAVGSTDQKDSAQTDHRED